MAGDTARILLNGNSYIVRLPLEREMIQQQTPAFRTTGAFLRVNNPKLEPHAFNNWSRGFGTKFIRPGHPEDSQGFFDATVLTIHKQAITLPPTRGAITDLADAAITASATFKGSLWALWSANSDSGDANLPVKSRKFSSGSWSGGGDVHTTRSWAHDLLAAGAKLYAVASGHGSSSQFIRYSTDGVTWTAPATTPPPGSLLTAGETYLTDGARLAYDGVNVVLALKDQVGGEIEIYKSTDGGDIWTSVVNFASGGGPTGAAAYLDIDDTVVIYVGSQEGVWLVDISTGTAELILPLPVATNNCMRMAVHNGALYVPVDYGADAPFGMKKITVRGGDRIIEDAGLDVAQGIPADLLGPVRWMASEGPFLFAAVGGAAANRNARIIAITGARNEGWQNVLKHPTANDLITWIGGSGNNLLEQEGGAPSSNSAATDPGDSRQLVDVLVPPGAGSPNYQSVADLQLPEFGGDDPENDGGFFQVLADAADLADGAEVLDFEYGLNGATPTTAGPTLDGTNRSQGLGTSSRGLSARTMRPNVEFNRGGTTGNTPKLREFVVLFRKRAPRLERITCTIDLQETARESNGIRGYSDLIGELETVFDTQIAVPFVESKDAGEIQVEVSGYKYLDWIRGSPQARDFAQREGTIKVVLEQLA